MTYKQWNEANLPYLMGKSEFIPLPSHIQRLQRKAFDLLVKRGFPRQTDTDALEGKSKNMAEMRETLVHTVTSERELRALRETSFRGLHKTRLNLDFERVKRSTTVPREAIHGILFLIRAGVKQPEGGYVPRSYSMDYLGSALFDYVPKEKAFSSLNAAVRAGFKPGEDRIYAAHAFSNGVSVASLRAFRLMGLRGKQILSASYLESKGMPPAELEKKFNDAYTKLSDPKKKRISRQIILKYLSEQAYAGRLGTRGQ